MNLTSKKVFASACSVLSINSIEYKITPVTECVPDIYYIYQEFNQVVKIRETESVRKTFGVSLNPKDSLLGVNVEAFF